MRRVRQLQPTDALLAVVGFACCLTLVLVLGAPPAGARPSHLTPGGRLAATAAPAHLAQTGTVPPSAAGSTTIAPASAPVVTQPASSVGLVVGGITTAVIAIGALLLYLRNRRPPGSRGI